MASGNSEWQIPIPVLGSKCHEISSDCHHRECDCEDKLSRSREPHRCGYSDTGSSSVDSSQHHLPTARQRTDMDEIEQLILAAEDLALERAKLKLNGIICAVPSVTSCSPSVIKRPGGSVRGRNISTATTVSAREDTSIHHRIIHQEMSQHLNLSDNVIMGAMSAGTSMNNNLMQADKLTSEHSANITNHDGSCRHSHEMEHLTENQISSFSESMISKSSISLTETKDHLAFKETDDSEENVQGIPKLTLEYSDESGYSSNIINERQDDHRRDEQRQGEEIVCEEKPVVSKNEKDVCNSSIRGSATGGSCDSSVTQGEVNSDNDHTFGSLLLRFERCEASTSVREGCSQLLTLALTATNNLRRATRLVRTVAASTPRFESSVGLDVEGELGEYDTLHNTLEAQLTDAASHLQVAVLGVQELETLVKDQCESERQGKEAASHLLSQVEAALLSCGLQHHLSMAITSPRSMRMCRALESAGCGVTLVAGEVERRGQHITTQEEQLTRHTQELHQLREMLLNSQARVKSVEVEMAEVRRQAKSDVTALQHCLAQAEESLIDAQQERSKTNQLSKKHSAESCAVIADLRKKLGRAQHKAEEKVAELEHRLQESETVRRGSEASLAEVQDQLTLRTQQMHLVNDENVSLIESLRETLTQQKGEIEQLRQLLEAAAAEKSSLTDKIHDLTGEMAVLEERGEELQGKVSVAREDTRRQQQEHSHIQKTLQDKIDILVLKQCELESQLRSLDLTVLQLRTEHQLERQRARGLTEENADLQKKTKVLQTQLWNSQARRRRNDSGERWTTTDKSLGGDGVGERSVKVQNVKNRSGEGLVDDGNGYTSKTCSEFGSCTSLASQASPLRTATTCQKNIQRDDDDSAREEESYKREQQLHTLLREKDVELISLQTSFSQQLSHKNLELESMNEKLETLEGEMSWVVSGLEASAALGDVTTEVGRQLQARTHHLQDLDQNSRVLNQHYADLSSENHSLSMAAVSARLEGREEAEDARDEARRAREEARVERLAAAHVQAKCQQLQAQLDSALTNLEQERREKQLNQVVQGVKHREFSTLLESAAATLHTTHDTLPHK